MDQLKVGPPQTQEEWDSYYQLRWEILRKPWNQPKGSERDANEDKCIHAALFFGTNDARAVGRIQMNSAEEAQIRYMAVAQHWQGKGGGKAIMNYLEKEVIKLGARKIILDARENAVEFYKACGYSVIEKSHLLFDDIQHWRMEKFL